MNLGTVRVSHQEDLAISSETYPQHVIFEALFNYKAIPFKEAISAIYSCDKLGVPLSRNIAIKVDHNINRVILSSRQVDIGVYVHLKSSFRLFTNSFNHELTSLGIPFVELKAS
jgi:hypothetical protein